MFCCEGKFYLVYLFHALIPISLGGCRNDGFILSEREERPGWRMDAIEWFIDTFCSEANSSDAIDCEPPLYSFHERRVGWGKETGYCPMFDCRWSIHPEIIRTKGYGFVWVSGAGNAMKFNEKMQET